MQKSIRMQFRKCDSYLSQSDREQDILGRSHKREKKEYGELHNDERTSSRRVVRLIDSEFQEFQSRRLHHWIRRFGNYGRYAYTTSWCGRKRLMYLKKKDEDVCGMRRMTSGRRIERPCSLLRLRRHKKDNKEERNPVVSLVYPIECQRERCQIINRILFAFRSCWLFLYENLDSSPEKKIKGELQHADHRWETHAGIISWKASRKWSGFIQRFLSYLIETTTQLSSTLLLLNGSHTIRTQEYAHDYYLIYIFFFSFNSDGRRRMKWYTLRYEISRARLPARQKQQHTKWLQGSSVKTGSYDRLVGSLHSTL